MKGFMKVTLVVLLALLLCVTALADEPEQAPDADELEAQPVFSAEGVLQAGGLFETAYPRRGPQLRSDPYAGAKQAIYEALVARQSTVDITQYAVPCDAFPASSRAL